MAVQHDFSDDESFCEENDFDVIDDQQLVNDEVVGNIENLNKSSRSPESSKSTESESSSSEDSSESSDDILPVKFDNRDFKDNIDRLEELVYSDIENCLPRPDIDLDYSENDESSKKSVTSEESPGGFVNCLDQSTKSDIEINKEATFFVDNDLEIDPDNNKDTLKKSVESAPHLISYDKLSESVVGNGRKRERSDDSLTSRKVAKFKHENKLQNMAILIKMEYEDRSFFELINDKWKNIEVENIPIERGMFLTLRELTKDLLLFILFKLDKEFCVDEKVANLRSRIQETIQTEYPNWRRSRSGKYLFFASFRTQKERNLYELSLPELKVVCAHFNLPTPKKFTKTFLTAFIEQELPKVSRNHPRRKNELIFVPDLNETEI